jgi:hypothetical protein
MLTASPRQRSVKANMQYYYQCRDSADAQLSESDIPEAPQDDGLEELELGSYINGVELEKVILTKHKQNELDHAEKAVGIGLNLGIFEKKDVPWPMVNPIAVAGQDAQLEVKTWGDALKRAGIERRTREIYASNISDSQDSGDVGAIMVDGTLDGTSAQPGIMYEGDQSIPPTQVDTSQLSEDQLRAFKIVEDHLAKSSADEEVEQLLMHIQGEGGTGKSKVIEKITELFQAHGKESKLRKSAYTGIAASLIEGATLHQLALLHQSSRLTKKGIERLRETWGDVEYLIIDEISMVSKRTLAIVSEMISIGKQKPGENNSTVPFGGVNVIIAGDFHQFPPVVGSGPGRGALYAPSIASHDIKPALGRQIYEQFTTVVLLKTQFRNKDGEWRGVLTRARGGKCTPDDVKTIRSLVLDPAKDKSLFTSGEWSNAVLVTPRHSVRNQWNELASRHHCRQTGHQLINSPAYDTHNNNPLSQTLRALVQSRTYATSEGGSTAKGDPGGLPDVVQIAIGMKVMVTYNVETELDIANGARGTVERIIIDNAEDEGTASTELACVRDLARPPLCVLVRLSKADVKWEIPGLERGVVPITPIRNRFQVALPNGTKPTLWRTQLPLTPAYAFTDYRSQGQTLPYVIVDLATPPTGGLTQFNAYVALSRSQTRSTARLLRNFEDRLFTTAPDENLVLEDAVLERQNETTRKSEFLTRLIFCIEH